MDWWPQIGKDYDCLQNRGKMKWINQQNEKRPWTEQWELHTLNQGLQPGNQGHNWLSHLKLRSKNWGNTTPIQHVLWKYTEAAGLILTYVCSVMSDSVTLGTSLPCSTVHGTFPARILEWVAISSSRGSFLEGSNLHLLSFLHCKWIHYSEPLGKLYLILMQPYLVTGISQEFLYLYASFCIILPRKYSPDLNLLNSTPV